MSTETTFYRVRRTDNGKHQWLDLESGVMWLDSPGIASAWLERTGPASAGHYARIYGAKVITVRHKLIPAKPRTHGRAWALRQLAKGRAVWNVGWPADVYLRVRSDGPRFQNGDYVAYGLDHHDGYTLWQEPAK